MKAQIYKDPRPAEYFQRYHNYARKHKPNIVYWLVRLFVVPLAIIVFRLKLEGKENVPKCGAAILAPNHGSFMDHFFVAALLWRKVRFAGKSQMFRGPMGWFYTMGGVFPVRRGCRDEELFSTAEQILESGGLLVWYAEGGRSRDGSLGKARPGIGRLMCKTGAVVVPIAIHNSHQVRNWRRLKFPHITVRFGKPITTEINLQARLADWQNASDGVLVRIQEEYNIIARR